MGGECIVANISVGAKSGGETFPLSQYEKVRQIHGKATLHTHARNSVQVENNGYSNYG